MHANPGPYQGDTSAVVGGNGHGQQRGAMAMVAAGMFVMKFVIIFVVILLLFYVFLCMLSLYLVVLVPTSTLVCHLLVDHCAD